MGYRHKLHDLKTAARARDLQKTPYASTQLWAGGSTHLLGLIGEWRYGVEISRDPDLSLDPAGDSGSDFDGVDVKAITFLSDPHLKVRPEDEEKDAWAFAGVLIDEVQMRAAYLGWLPAEVMFTLPTRDYGYGPMHHQPWDLLFAGLPQPLLTC
jgi:hypothetical protein